MKRSQTWFTFAELEKALAIPSATIAHVEVDTASRSMRAILSGVGEDIEDGIEAMHVELPAPSLEELAVVDLMGVAQKMTTEPEKHLGSSKGQDAGNA